ncbi:MAG TPA: hypothetical protein VMT00_11980 [Thermoanaerobaculia bacterium]|nr:hypothetical protein [Thermoanaerobaculia bacterium]
MGRLGDYWKDECGQSATEYILIIGLISVPIWVAFKLLLEKFLKEFVAKVIGTFTRG